MKKSIVFVLVLCLAVLSAFAGSIGVKVQAEPYSLQSVTVTGGRYLSTYGYGVCGGLRYGFTENLSAGVDVGLDVYKYKELQDIDSDYNVTKLRAVAGYKYAFLPKLYAEAELGVGADFREIADSSMITFGADAYVGMGFRISNELAVTAGADVGLSFQSGKKSKSTDFSVTANAGITATL